MKAIQAGLIAVSALAMAGCGSGAKIGNQQEAAQAAFQAGQASRGANGGLLQVLQSGAGGNGSVTVQGDASGSATVTATVNTTASGESIDMNITYSNFSEDGHNQYNGNWTITLVSSTTATGGSITGTVTLTMNGSLTISGSVDDTLTATNFAETLDFSALTGTSGSATLTLNGQLATSTSTYTYTNQSYSFSATASL
jgi:hypothetical protein